VLWAAAHREVPRPLPRLLQARPPPWGAGAGGESAEGFGEVCRLWWAVGWDVPMDRGGESCPL